MSNKRSLSDDLESDLFLNSALQRFTCELYYRFGLFLAPLSVGPITSSLYLLEHGVKNGGPSGDDKHDEQTADNSE